MNTVLIVEDNKSLSKSLTELLSKDYEVTAVERGREAITVATQETFDIIILDLGLPDINGEEVCSVVRDRGVKTSILVLTATDKVSSRVNMLDIGADDYLLKPFYVGEIQARLRALLRRSNNPIKGHVMHIGDLTLDSARREVERGGKSIQLRRKEFDILEYLMKNRGTVVTRTMIINNNWEPGADRWNNTIDVHIKYIRDKIDKPFSKKLIKTAYGVGYMIDDV